MPDKADIRRYRANLQGEVDSAALYRRPGRCRSRTRSCEGLRRWPRSRSAHARVLAQPAGGGRGRPAPRPSLARPGAGLAGAAVRPGLRAADHRRRRGARQHAYDNQPEAVAAGLPDRRALPRPRIVQAVAAERSGLVRPAIAAAGGAPPRRRRQRAARRGAGRQ